MDRTISVGADLRLARERLGWDLPGLSARLRIRLPYLEAIEDGRLSDLPGNAYAVGFLRTYAVAVGLDADEMSRRFRSEMAELNRLPELVFPAPVPERGVPALAMVMVGLVLVIGAYAGWYHFTGEGTKRDVATAELPEHLAPLSAGLTPLPPVAPPAQASTPPSAAVTTPSAAAAPVAAPAPAPLAIAIPVPVPVPVTLPSSAPAGMSADAAYAANASAAAGAASPTPPPGSGQNLATLGPDGGRLAVHATQEAWIQIKDRATGSVVTDRTMKAGEVYQVPNRTGLVLTVGNAGGTEVLLDGKATPSLGADGAVRRGLPLEIDQVRDGKLAASYTPPTTAPNASAAPQRPTTQN